MEARTRELLVGCVAVNTAVSLQPQHLGKIALAVLHAGK